MRLELAYPTPIVGGVPTPYNLSKTIPAWFQVNNTDVDGIDELHLEITKEENNQVKKKMTGDLLFYNGTSNIKDLILNAFYNSAIPVEYMWVRIYDCDCNVYIFTGQITRDKIEWCTGECFVKCRASEYDEVTDAYNSLNNILNYDAYLADTSEVFINVPNVDTSALIVQTTYQPAVRVGGLLKNSIRSLPEFVFKSSILDSATGLNGWTGDVYGIDMSAYLSMSWDVAGTVDMPMGTLNPYNYLYLLNCDISKGKRLSDVGNYIDEQHKYLRTIKDFLNELKTVFNADFLIKKVGSDVHFIFERKDYFEQSSTIWQDCTSYDVCFDLNDRNRYAYADISFTTPSSFSGESAIGYAYSAYKTIREWNNPVSPLQKDAYYSACVFSGVPVSRSQEMQLKNPFILSPPALIIPGAVQLGFGNSIGTYDAGTYTNRVFDQNRPMYEVGDIAKVAFPTSTTSKYYNCNLYDCFHFIENPRNAPNNVGYLSRYSKKYLKYSVEVEFTCAEYLAYESDSSISINLFGTIIKAPIDNIDFDFQKRTAQIRGLI